MAETLSRHAIQYYAFLDIVCLAVAASILALRAARFAEVLPGPADNLVVVGSLDVPGRGKPEVVAFDAEDEGRPDGTGRVDGRVIVLATVSAGVDAARDLIVEVVALLDGEVLGIKDILPALMLAGRTEAEGRMRRRFVCPAPSAPNVLDEVVAGGRERPGLAV